VLTAADKELLALEYDLCSHDALYWITNYGYIKDERTGKEYGPGLDLWPGVGGYPGQADFVLAYAAGMDIEDLKARQLGKSWLAENIDFWDILFHKCIRLAIIDKNEPDAWDHIERIKLIYNKLAADEQRRFILAGRSPLSGKDSKGEFALGNRDDYSLIRSYPCTAGATRGPAVKRVRLEEYAFYPNVDAVLAAIHATTADTGGQVVGISTGNGEGTPHHKRWLDATSGKSGAQPMFFPWYLRPDRDEEWYRKTRAKYPSEALFKQEFPATPDEAFMASGSAYFNKQEIDDCYREMEPIDQPYPGWNIYAGYEVGGCYYISGDTADAGGDACSASVRCVSDETCEQVAHIHSYDWDSGAFADQLADLGKRYGYPMIVLEREGYGMKVYERLRSTWHYPKLYVHDDGKDGLPTTSVTRPMMLGDLAIAKRELRWIEHSPQTYAEQVAFAWIKGKPQAPAGMHDDCVMDSAVGARVLPKMVSQAYIPQARKSDIYK